MNIALLIMILLFITYGISRNSVEENPEESFQPASESVK